MRYLPYYKETVSRWIHHNIMEFSPWPGRSRSPQAEHATGDEEWPHLMLEIVYQPMRVKQKDLAEKLWGETLRHWMVMEMVIGTRIFGVNPDEHDCVVLVWHGYGMKEIAAASLSHS